ncbi:MAG: YfcC family protein [Bacteroidota bacterium]
MPGSGYRFRLPPPIILLSMMILLATVLTWVIPAGSFERMASDSGRPQIIPGSFKWLPESQAVNSWQMIRAVPDGFARALPVIFICLISAVMFAFLEKARTIERAVGALIYNLGQDRSGIIITLLTFIYGFLGIFVGYENNIATIPIACVVVLALGGDLILAAGVAIGGMTVGFGLSPFNLYTVGVGHELSGLPMFSGAGLRSLLCLGGLGIMSWFNMRYFQRLKAGKTGQLGQGLDTSGFEFDPDQRQLSTANWMQLAVFGAGLLAVIYGGLKLGWRINDVSGVFIIISIFCAFISRLSIKELSDAATEGIARMAPPTFVIGLATTISVILQQGQIIDSLSYGIGQALVNLPPALSAVLMTIFQGAFNMLVPSGSGQAYATLPVMLPLGETVGLSQQASILAFQIGDGLTNLINPSLPGLAAMLLYCRVPFERWFVFVLPLVGIVLLWAVSGLMLAVILGWS